MADVYRDLIRRIGLFLRKKSSTTGTSRNRANTIALSLTALPSLAEQWQEPGSVPSPFAGNGATEAASGPLSGKVDLLKRTDKYGFLGTPDGHRYFFHISDLVDRTEWEALRTGMRVTFESAGVLIPGKNPSAKNVRPMRRR